jgi:spermidine synthase
VLGAVFAASGAAALVYQSSWQRMLSLHAGMDLYAVTTVVAAFMAGLGLGNLAGGRLAEGLTPRRAVITYAVLELGIAGFGLVSPLVLYRWAPHLMEGAGTAVSFGCHFLLLALPTASMGATLPLLAKGVIERDDDIAPSLGRLWGLNALGAAGGALAMSGHWLLGNVGLDGATRVAASLNVACGLLALLLQPTASNSPADEPSSPSSARFWPWALTYAVTGFAALGLEVTWFRLLNVVGRSTTFFFSRLLLMYLVGLSLGSLLTARRAQKLQSPADVFLGLQGAAGLAALTGPLLVWGYFGFAVDKLRPFPRDVLAPLVVLLAPTLLMGAAFPVLQRLTGMHRAGLSQRLGALLFANTVGCVLGTTATGFVFLHQLGTPRTLSLLALVLCLVAVIGLWRSHRLAATGIFVVGFTLAFAMPDGARFWGPLHGVPAASLTPHEDGSCMTAIVERPTGQHTLFISGEQQNGVPFDDFHVRLGTLPALLHPAPKRVLVIGLGAGSTPFGLVMDPRVERVRCVEICPGERPLLEQVAAKGNGEMRRLFADRRVDYEYLDGRKALLDDTQQYDLIVTDTLLTISAYSGSLYSKEFYQLVARRLAPGGLFAQWVPSERIYETARSVFRAVMVPTADELGGEPQLLIASDTPIAVDGATLLERAQQFDASELPTPTWSRLLGVLPSLRATDPRSAQPLEINTDLFPRDEFSAW